MLRDWTAEFPDRLVERRHQSDTSVSIALYSPCETYRYGLGRQWEAQRPPVLFVMLNPSTATELRNDPTIERCERRARAMGFGGVMIANLFAFRATQPADLKRAADPVGPLNDAVVQQWHALSGKTVAAWGVHGAHLNRAETFTDLLPGPLFHLGLTKAGHPRHPLYVSYTIKPILWET